MRYRPPLPIPPKKEEAPPAPKKKRTPKKPKKGDDDEDISGQLGELLAEVVPGGFERVQ